MTPEDEARAMAFINAAEWTFAATMKWAPHAYATRQRCRELGIESGFLALAQLIEDSGWWRIYGQHRYRSLIVGPHTYWLHWSVWPVAQRTIINRWWTERMRPDSGQLAFEVDA